MSDSDRQPPAAPKTGGRDPKKKKPLGADKGKLNADVQLKIGQQLKSMYSDVVNEGVPDRFADLIARLDKDNE